MSATSLRAYARHRDCHLNSVQAAIKTGRITAALLKDENGKTRGIDFALADTLWTANTDPAAVAKGRAQRMPKRDKKQTAYQDNSAAVTQSAPSRTDVRPALPSPAPASTDASSAAHALTTARGSTPNGTGDSEHSVDPGGDYHEHRAKHERFKAATAELEFHKLAGALVESAVVEREQFKIWRRVRDMYQLAFDHADATLATIPAASRVRVQLRAESRQVLDELAKNLDDSARTGDECEETGTEISS